MRIQRLLETEFTPSSLPSESFYHVGPDFDQFSTDFLGKGENNHLLGFGCYFINNTNVAKGYAKYVARDPVMYEVKLNAPSDRFYCGRNKPTDEQAARYDKIAQALGYENRRAVPYNHSIMKFGRGLPGAVFSRLGAQRGLELLINNGVVGQFEDIGVDNLFEVAVYDTSIINILNKTPM